MAKDMSPGDAGNWGAQNPDSRAAELGVAPISSDQGEFQSTSEPSTATRGGTSEGSDKGDYGRHFSQ